MTQTFGMSGMTDQEVNESYQYILETFSKLDPKVKLSIANSIWYRNTFSVEQEFLKTNQDYFQAEVKALDFNDAGSVDIINQWVSDKTNALIPTIVNSISDDMVMYLINAVYFKGQWKYTFEKSNTHDNLFRFEDGTHITTSFMKQKATFPVYKNEMFSAIELPYNQGNYNMVVMLPETGKGINDIISQLSQENWTNWYRQFSSDEVTLTLPKFKFAYEEKKMKPAMMEMGMTDAFIPDLADFTRINSNGGIFISEVKHKTFIETNEEGTEAAAVTSIGMETTSVGPPEMEFKADKPFVFFIHEKQTGSILFIGTVMNPALEN
ncbi:MAG: serpin family protein [Bacteroidales bacterium]|nr:serpin family protein [Bacteroidales bacterium]